MTSKCRRFQEEFALQNFKLSYEYPDDFILPHWQSTSLVDPFYVTYRCLFLLTILGMFYIAIRWTSNVPITIKARSLAFVTNWGYFLCLVDALIALLIVIKAHLKQIEQDSSAIPDFPILCRLYWVLQNVTTELNVSVSLAYWSFVRCTEPKHATDSALHIWNVALVLMDFFIVSVPIRIYHVYFSLILGIVYCVFSYVYYLLGGLRLDNEHYLYKVLDWKNNPIGAGFVCLGGLGILIAVRFLLFGLFRLRTWIYYTCYDEEGITDVTRRGVVL